MHLAPGDGTWQFLQFGVQPQTLSFVSNQLVDVKEISHGQISRKPE